ncbi:hypothetical protein KFK09_027181 [Dendrobium nobile]|uniref:Uncharacterized protein n=1 Tax=Dendrobium nobile TaxID=94219 RepID=A0A8T3AF50_DENNO|nr:hypothetical protein KFK09_027181 [Dendrobium nobile]
MPCRNPAANGAAPINSPHILRLASIKPPSASLNTERSQGFRSLFPRTTKAPPLSLLPRLSPELHSLPSQTKAPTPVAIRSLPRLLSLDSSFCSDSNLTTELHCAALLSYLDPCANPDDYAGIITPKP